MRKALVGVVAATALFVPTVSPALGSGSPTTDTAREPESCYAFNPGQPTCSFTVTSTSSSGTVTGAVGPGDWVVVVKRGKQKIVLKPTSPEPVAFAYQVGDKVKATVNAAGGFVLAGHD
ncbi:MAG TPA: hypothetical protein VNP73_00555 [Actinomycetota bacterium]|nr:hypothetical protein [Actinomycetota bacterium]